MRSSIMLSLIAFELAALAGLWVLFVVFMTFRRVGKKIRVLRWWESSWSNQLVGIALLGIVEAVALFSAATNNAPPLWVFALIFGAIDIVTARWLWLIWKARRVSEVD